MTAVVSYSNLIDAVTAVVTLPNDTADTDHPISNLKLRGLGDYLQVVAVEDFIIVSVDFGATKTFNFIAAMGLDVTSVPDVSFAQISYSTSPDGIVWTVIGAAFFTDAAPLGLPGVVYAVIPAGVTTRYLRMSIEWNTSSTPKRFARLWVDNALILADAVEDSSAEFSFVDAGELSETDGQQYVEFRKLRTKNLQLKFRGLTTLQMWGFSNGDSEAFNVPSINGMQFAAGNTGEVIVLPITSTGNTLTDALWQRRTGVYGHVVSPYAITRDLNSESWTAGMTVQEER